MPAFVSHTIMAKDVYKRLNDKNVSLDYMVTFSLGGDLSKYSKCRRDSHNIKQDLFITNMADYMISNNLSNDSECLGVLYGHICHYVMDKTMHPLIRRVDKSCKRYKKNHTLIEGYYDSYLSKKYMDTPIDKVNYNNLFKGKMNKKVSDMINSVYNETYNTKHLSFYYKFNIFLYKKIKYLYKIFSLKTLKRVSKFDRFMSDNRSIDIINSEVDETYIDSVNEALSYIKKISEYIKNKS